MESLKKNAVPLAVGVAVGYLLAKHGGLKGVTAKVRSAA
jgi:hypothetical protein